jgi:hypothetical protein
MRRQGLLIETETRPAHSLQQKLGPLLRGFGSRIRRKSLAVFDWNNVRVEPLFECFESALIPFQAPGEIVCGSERNELVVRPEVDDGGLDVFSVKLRVELNVANVTDCVEVGVAFIPGRVTSMHTRDHHHHTPAAIGPACGSENGQNKAGGVMVELRAGTLAFSIHLKSPPVSGCVEFWAENLRNLVKLEWPKARLDDVGICGMKGLQLRTVANARTHFAVVLWGVNREKDYCEANGTQRAEHNGDWDASFRVRIYHGLTRR